MARRFFNYSKNSLKISEMVSHFVSTWVFVFIYTIAMVLWIILHQLEILKIDSKDFIKWNLWLSYFAGIQASIVLMASNRESKRDRRKHEKAFALDKTMYQLIQCMIKQIDDLEEVVHDLLKEQE